MVVFFWAIEAGVALLDNWSRKWFGRKGPYCGPGYGASYRDTGQVQSTCTPSSRGSYFSYGQAHVKRGKVLA